MMLYIYQQKSQAAMQQPPPQSWNYDIIGHKQMTCFVCVDGAIFLEEEMALKLDFVKDKIKNNVVQLQGIPLSNLISIVNDPERILVDPEHALPIRTLFHFIQAAYHGKIQSLMDSTCQTLAHKVKTMFTIDQGYGPSSARKRLKRDPGAVPPGHQVFDNNGNYRLRSHTIEEFINFSEFVDMFHYRLLDSDEKTENLFSEKENPVFDYLVEEFGESSQFLVKRNLLNDIMELYKNQEVEYSCHLSKEVDELKANMIKRLSYSLHRLFLVVGQDQGLANLIEDCVALRLLKILENLDLLDIQYFAAGILSLASFDECGWVMKKAVPVLLKLICSQRCDLLAVEATVTLMRLANKAPHVINVSLLRDLSALVKASKSHGLIVHLAMFLAFVCRRPDLSIDEKKNVLLPILGELLGKDFKPPHGCRKDFKPPHGYKVLACYSLSYLTYDSYETCAAVRVQICERLVELTSHESSSVVGSALGVIGNIVRWGNPEQIENFAKGCMFLQWLDKNVLCSDMKKIQAQGCQIISNIAARRETLIEVMVKAGLVDPICTLLEGDQPDVKMEAAWAILYMFCDKD